MNDFYSTSAEMYLREQKEKKDIKYIGRVAGMCIIFYVVIQNVLSLFLLSGTLRSAYYSDPDFQSVVSVIFSVSSVLVPFAVGGYFINKRTKTDIFNLSAPVSNKLMLTAVPLGFFVCLVGNYVTSCFVDFVDKFGIHLTAPETETPSGFGGRFLYVLSIAVIPPLVEEFAIRGVVMQPLRKYGDKFAILASAIVFAVLHGNLVQAPFALIAGIGIGYAVCITNSVWTGVLIHAMNNLYSVVIEFMIADITDEAMLDKVYIITTVLLYAVSIAGSVFFFILKKNRKIMPSFTALREKNKLFAFIWSIPMIIALMIMYSVTKNYVELG
ncbi:MAG: CPBP family intramembrane metalloprotease [Clostridia bacterium]|nr:CPBP family intramembrane metalloprotease [Clostridia bacterium]